MFVINEDKSIYITRGDVAFFTVPSKTDTGEAYKFQSGDVLRFKVFEKKNCENVVLQKDFGVEGETEEPLLYLEEKDTKIGDVISKPVDYWYEVELNPYTDPQTIIGYDEDGAKIFKLFPEGNEKEDDEPITPEDVPVVDEELDLTSTRPVQNQAISRAILKIADDINRQIQGLSDEMRSKIVTEVAKKFEGKDEQIDLIIEEAVAEFSGRVDEEVASAIRNIAGEIYTTENKPTAIETWNEKENDANRRALSVNNSAEKNDVSQALVLTDRVNSNNKDYLIYGEHNKPSGSYTGNGSAAARTITIGGTAPYGIVLIMGNGSATLVTYSGSISTSSPLGNNQLMSFGRDEIKYVNGVLTIQTADVRLNKSDLIYTYQVL